MSELKNQVGVRNLENRFNLLSADILTMLLAMEKKKANPMDIARIEAYYLSMQKLVQDLLKEIHEAKKELAINYILEGERSKEDIVWIEEYRALKVKTRDALKRLKVPQKQIDAYLAPISDEK